FSSDVYIPPPRPGSTSKNSGSSDAVELKQRRFGIPLGTWVSAKLNRQTTNSDPGLIELITTQDIVGQHKTLPIGTYLFSQKQFNSGTKRLDLHIVLARLPDGKEIEINCLVYDSQKVAGLQGIIVENNSGAVEQGFKTGLVNAGQSLVNQGTQGSVAGSVLSSTAESLADTQNASINAQSKSLFTVHVSPQPVQVQVQTTF
ncbi:MAG: conjugative transposon protein TraM, partial [Planctomycetes bacterium]|nr:conjugative transposon protein TraM [Planctomycetota bacterium]